MHKNVINNKRSLKNISITFHMILQKARGHTSFTSQLNFWSVPPCFCELLLLLRAVGSGGAGPHFLAKQLTLSLPEGQIMPTTLLQAPLRIFRPCDGPATATYDTYDVAQWYKMFILFLNNYNFLHFWGDFV